MRPGQAGVQRQGLVGVVFAAHAGFIHRHLPFVPVPVFVPGIQAGAVSPGLLDDLTDPAVASDDHRFQDASLDAVEPK